MMMNEKQFVLYEHKENYYILKNPRIHLDFIEMLGDALTPEEIVEELNQLDDKVVKLAEENEQLKEENGQLHYKLQQTKEDLQTKIDECKNHKKMEEIVFGVEQAVEYEKALLQFQKGLKRRLNDE